MWGLATCSDVEANARRSRLHLRCDLQHVMGLEGDGTKKGVQVRPCILHEDVY